MPMRRVRHFMLESGLLAVIGLASIASAEIKLGNGFEADELVQEIAISIEVGADGTPIDVSPHIFVTYGHHNGEWRAMAVV